MVIIKKSTIHGKGVFTTQFIPSGTLLECDILEVCGVELLDKYVFPYIGTRNCLHIGSYVVVFYFFLGTLLRSQKSISPLNTRKLSPNSLNPITQR